MKIDRQKAYIDFLRDRYKNYFLVLFGIIGSTIGLLFQIILLKVPFFMLFFVIIGFIISCFLYMAMKEIKNEILNKIYELEV